MSNENTSSPSLQIKQIDAAIKLLKLRHEEILSSIRQSTCSTTTSSLNLQSTTGTEMSYLALNPAFGRNATFAAYTPSQNHQSLNMAPKPSSLQRCNCPDSLTSSNSAMQYSLLCHQLFGPHQIVAPINFDAVSSQQLSAASLPKIVVPHFEDFASSPPQPSALDRKDLCLTPTQKRGPPQENDQLEAPGKDTADHHASAKRIRPA